MSLANKCTLLNTNFNFVLFPRNVNRRRVAEIMVDSLINSGYYVALILNHCLPNNYQGNFSVTIYDEVDVINTMLHRSDYLVIFSDLNEMISTPQLNLTNPAAKVIVLTTWGDKINIALNEHVLAYNLYKLDRPSLTKKLSGKIRQLPPEIANRLSKTTYQSESERTKWNLIPIELTPEHSLLIYNTVDSAETSMADTRVINFLSMIAVPNIKKLYDTFRINQLSDKIVTDITELLAKDLLSSAPKLYRLKSEVLNNSSDKHLIIGQHQVMLKLLLTSLFSGVSLPLFFPTKKCNDPELAKFADSNSGICVLTELPHDLNTDAQHIHVVESYPFDLTRRLSNLTLPENVNLYVSIYNLTVNNLGLLSPDEQQFMKFVRRSQVADYAVEILEQDAEYLHL